MSSTKRINEGSPGFPALPKNYLGSQTPKSLAFLGNGDILKQKKLALICSVKCPGDLILQTFDFMQALRESEVVVASGFHSPMEKECLRILLKGSQPILISLPRSIENMRMPDHYRKPLASGRLLIMSCLPEGQKRITTETALINNRFFAALSDAVFVPYAAPGGKTDALCRQLAAQGKKLITLQHSENQSLIQLGAVPIDPSSKTAGTKLSQSLIRILGALGKDGHHSEGNS